MGRLALDALAGQFRRVWLIDFEYRQPDGDLPTVHCMVARDIISGETLRLWADDLRRCPFACDASELFVAYAASAEASCFLALGWPRPRRVLDLFAEFRRLCNGVADLFGRGLLGALQYFSLPTMDAEEKREMRDLAIRGGPFSLSERADLLAYCESDVLALDRLLDPLWRNSGLSDPRTLAQALFRGAYMVAVAAVERNGTAINIDLYDRIRANLPTIRRGIIAAAAATYGVYDGVSFRVDRFEGYLGLHGIPWPRLASGDLDLADDTFADVEKAYPQISLLRATRQLNSKLNLFGLAIGRDGRNRASLMPFQSVTGRNQPSNVKFIFGPAKWLRCLIQPAEGRAIAYLDWSAQELGIAGAISGDAALWDAYASGDPYLAFAVRAGLAPAGATKTTHKEIRNVCKVLVLGTNYGMEARSIAAKSGLHIVEARDLLRRYRAAYPTYAAWSEQVRNRALMGLPLRTAFGWQMTWPPGVSVGVKLNDRSAANWPMQANGAEMMRIAVVKAVEAGLMVCAPVHDALLLESSVDAIDHDVEHLKQIMGDASEAVLGGDRRIRVDAQVTRWPDHYEDERAVETFGVIGRLLGEAERSGGLRERDGGLCDLEIEGYDFGRATGR